MRVSWPKNPRLQLFRKTGPELQLSRKNLETTPNTTSLTQQAKSLEVGRLSNVHWRNDLKLKGVTNQLIIFHSRFMLTIASFGRNLTWITCVVKQKISGSLVFFFFHHMCLLPHTLLDLPFLSPCIGKVSEWCHFIRSSKHPVTPSLRVTANQYECVASLPLLYQFVHHDNRSSLFKVAIPHVHIK